MVDLVKALADSNALAVVVAAVGAFLIGAAWYSPALFAKQWIKGNGWTQKEMDKARSEGGMAQKMAYCFIATVLLSLAVSMLFNLIGVDGLWSGLMVGLFVGLGISVTTMYVHHIFERTTGQVFLINAGYNLAMCAVIGAVLGVWPK
jgi:hypothetical protein